MTCLFEDLRVKKLKENDLLYNGADRAAEAGAAGALLGAGGTG